MTNPRLAAILLSAVITLLGSSGPAGADQPTPLSSDVTVVCSWEWQVIGGVEAPFSVEPAVCSGWLDEDGGALISFWAPGSQTYGECDASAELDFSGQDDGHGRLSWLNPAGLDGPRIEFLPASCEPHHGQPGGVLRGGVAQFCDPDDNCSGTGLLMGYGGRVLVHFI